MIKNYFLSALRNHWNNRSYFLINIFGLLIGISSSLAIFRYINHESSYDSFHEDKERICRVAMYKYEQGASRQSFAFTFPAVAPQLKQEFPEVEEAVRMRRQRLLTRYGDQVHSEIVYYVDEAFLGMFSFPLLEGDAETALAHPSSVVISEEMAVKYFAGESSVGKQLEVPYRGEWRAFTVTGVLKDIPENSHMGFDFLYPYKTYIELVASFGGDAENSWTWSDFYTYVKLRPGSDIADTQAKLAGFAERNMQNLFDEYGYRIEFSLQPIRDIHLHSSLDYELKSNGNANYVKAMILIAVFILLLAWINYINLSTARSMDRAKEVGIRKVIGASKGQIIAQFLIETMIITGISLGLSYFLFLILQPSFANLVGKELQGKLWNDSLFWMGFIAMILIGSLLAGIYPAAVLSKFKPMQALKNSWQIGAFRFSKGALRKGLVAFQFCISVALIASALIMHRQIEYMRSQDLGVNIDQTLILSNQALRDSTYLSKSSNLITQLENIPEIVEVAASGDIPGKEVGSSTNMRWKGLQTNNTRRVRTFGIDDRFIGSYGLQLIAGRNFDRNFGTEENMVILNETALNVLGLENAQQAIGQEITNSNESFTAQVIGVIKDYHQESLRFQFKPVVYYFLGDQASYYSLKVNTANHQDLLTKVENAWNNVFPNAPFSHFFLEEYFDRQHLADIRFGKIITLFTVLSIVVACLGLFGLFSFSISKRTREIGIRKVVGASSFQIIRLISLEIMSILLISSLIALPVAWLLARNWLEAYAFKVNLDIWFFLLPVAFIFLIAWITVGGQSWKASMTDPVESLRNE